MEHAITIGDVLWVVLPIGGFVGVAALIFFAIWLMNPFRSGH